MKTVKAFASNPLPLSAIVLISHEILYFITLYTGHRRFPDQRILQPERHPSFARRTGPCRTLGVGHAGQCPICAAIHARSFRVATPGARHVGLAHRASPLQTLPAPDGQPHPHRLQLFPPARGRPAESLCLSVQGRHQPRTSEGGRGAAVLPIGGGEGGADG